MMEPQQDIKMTDIQDVTPVVEVPNVPEPAPAPEPIVPPEVVVEVAGDAPKSLGENISVVNIYTPQ